MLERYNEALPNKFWGIQNYFAEYQEALKLT